MDKGTCPVCGKFVAIYVPRHGDGTVRVLRWHYHWKGRYACPGGRKPCREDELALAPQFPQIAEALEVQG